MKKLYFFVLCFLLFFCPIAVQSHKIAEAHSLNPMSEEAIRYLQVEDMYQGSLSWKGDKASTKFNYNKPKKK
tara:strand:+ start:162 stop:377 length:216 start_codon:yes stop_codon:yes gene_type:complete